MDTVAKIRKKVVSKHDSASRMEKEERRLTRDGTTERLGRPNSQARTGTGKYSFSLFS